MKNILKVIFTMIFSFSWLFAASGGDIFRSSLFVDQLEYQQNDEKSTSWNSYLFAGYDLNKIYIYSEGEKPKDDKASSETRLLYSRAATSFWDIQAGFEYDKIPENSKTWAILGFQGLAPYFFETQGSLLFSKDGNIGLKIDMEYDALLTQRLILAPSAKFSAFNKDEKDIEIGKGVSNVTMGVRLRYEFTREFAPYIGYEWSKNYGNTNEYSTLNDEYVTFGLRFWI